MSPEHITDSRQVSTEIDNHNLFVALQAYSSCPGEAFDLIQEWFKAQGVTVYIESTVMESFDKLEQSAKKVLKLIGEDK